MASVASSTSLKPPIPSSSHENHNPKNLSPTNQPHQYLRHRPSPPSRRLRPFIAPLHEFAQLRDASARAFDRLLLPYPQFPPPGPLVTLAFDYMSLRPVATTARRLTHLTLTDPQGGEAAVYAIRKKLASNDREYALDVLCAVMKLCPWFYRFCAGERFWNELWKGKFHCGDKMVADDRKCVARMVEGWVESLNRGAEKDPAARFWIGKYIKKVQGGGWVTEGGTVNSWVCWVSDSGVLAGGHPRLYAPQYRDTPLVLDAEAPEFSAYEDCFDYEDKDEYGDIVAPLPSSKILASSRRRRKNIRRVRIASKPEIIPSTRGKSPDRDTKDEKYKPNIPRPELVRKARNEKDKKKKCDHEREQVKKTRAEQQKRRYEEAIERAHALDTNLEKKSSESSLSSPPPSQYGSTSVAAMARARARERLNKSQDAVLLRERKRQSDECRKVKEEGVVEKARARARARLKDWKRRISAETDETVMTEVDDVGIVDSQSVVTPCTFSFLPVINERIQRDQGHESSSLSDDVPRKGRQQPKNEANTGAFGSVQGGVGPIFRLLTEDSYSPEDLQSVGNESIAYDEDFAVL